MSRYRNDPRVTVSGNGYAVTVDGTTYRVLHSDVLGWGVYTGPNLDLVYTTDNEWACGLADADDAIALLLGQPPVEGQR